MAKSGILIDYYYCTGCHSCEVACQQEHNYPADVFGVTVSEHVLKTLDGLPEDSVHCAELTVNTLREAIANRP